MGETGPVGQVLATLGGRARLVLLLIAVALVGAGSASWLQASAQPATQGDATPVGDVAATPQIQPPVTGDAGTPTATDPCAALAPGTGAEGWVQTELYFGRGVDDTDSEITDEEWQAFLDSEVTPRFPDGLTVLDGYGQFLNAAGTIAAEDSTVLIILYPMDPTGATSGALEEIREAYNVEFGQESVLRTDTYPVCVGF